MMTAKQIFTTPCIISFANRMDFSINRKCYGLAIGDIDMDGKPEIFLTLINY